MNPTTKQPMSQTAFFGRRRELDDILALAKPNDDLRSAVVMIEGPGGIGKSVLLRHAFSEIRNNFPKIRCIKPLDMDDTDFRVASNTGMSIAMALSKRSFARYIAANRRYVEFETGIFDRDTMRSYMTMGDRYFLSDYIAFARRHRIAIFIDTIEAIRGTHIWAYFMRMMAALPNTLFILAGRPQSQVVGGPATFEWELDRFARVSHIGEPNVKHIVLSGWSTLEAIGYVRATEVGKHLPHRELVNLLHLSRCRPLHLTLALKLPRPRRLVALGRMSEDDLREVSLYRSTIEEISDDHRTDPPDVGLAELSERGKELVASFERELLLHLAGVDPLSQTMRRLSHVRRRLDALMYQQVLNFTPAIENAPTWKTLLREPWIRRRAEQYISVHDIVSELVRQHIWPVRDPSGSERRRLSQSCVALYDSLLCNQREELQNLITMRGDIESGLVDLDEEYYQIGSKVDAQDDLSGQPAALEHRRKLETQLSDVEHSIHEITRQAWVLEAERLYYLLDADLQRGYQDFIHRFDETSKDGQLIVREMILGEIEGFIDSFANSSEERYQIGIRQIDTAIDENLLVKARSIVELLRSQALDNSKQYVLLNRLGNIDLRTPGRIAEGIDCFKRAVNLTLRYEELQGMQGSALRELGWSYRQLGRWEEAARQYGEALVHTPLSERRARSQILRNLAYVEALSGNYDEAKTFIDSSLNYHRSQDDPIGLGAALSVKGEIHRYQREFEMAHTSYDEAIGLFGNADALGWLGLVQQEKAICLIQQSNRREYVEEADHLIAGAIYLCREFSPRNYPSALNRAGRIYIAGIENKPPNQRTSENYARPFEAFRDGIREAQLVEDTWFEMANAIEYAELALKLWERNGSSTNRERIFTYQDIVEAKKKDEHLGFSDLFGRWHLIKAHVAWKEGKRLQKTEPTLGAQLWAEACTEYATGFRLIAKGYFGSHGVRAIPIEGAKLQANVLQMPKGTALEWCESLEREWGAEISRNALLLGIVEQIYDEVQGKSRQRGR